MVMMPIKKLKLTLSTFPISKNKQVKVLKINKENIMCFT